MDSGGESGTTRRRFLTALGAIGGAAAVYDAVSVLGLLRVRSAHARTLPFEPGLGKGRSVLVLGAGMAGLAAAWNLARNGFAVTILEATNRIGGRNLTLRDGDRFAEEAGPVQTCRFVRNEYSDGRPVEVQTYMNAGPGRIGQHSAIVLDYCRQFGVALQPYIFAGASNLLQSDKAFGGKPIPFRRIRNGFRHEIADLLEQAVKQGALDKPLTGVDREKFAAALRDFAGYSTRSFEAIRAKGGSLSQDDEPRNGYSVDPGAGLHYGSPYPDLPLERIVDSNFWNTGLFAALTYRWQAAMLEPVGGMDMIWRRMVARPLPDGRTLEDMIHLKAPVTDLRNLPDGVKAVTADGQSWSADYCISTAAPAVLAKIGSNLAAPLKAACAKVTYIPSAKVGGQMRGRFWEELPDSTERIFGGISWTDAVTTQVWYPSSQFQTRCGILTMAYSSDERALKLGAMSPPERVEAALVQGEKFHPGLFRRHFIPESGVSIAWHKMPFQFGVCADDTSYQDPALYKVLVDGSPDGQIHLAGDWLSSSAGWLDGAFDSAELAVAQITERVRPR